jgi:Gluconate 2-dehydrogenase subunit 3
MSTEMEQNGPTIDAEAVALISRREAIRRVTALLGGVALVGGSALLTGCADRSSALGRDSKFTPEDVAFLDEVADTILPDTPKSPGAKAAKTGAFMALMVTDSYDKRDQDAFRDGMRAIDDASMKENKVGFMQATPQQRLALLERLDREQKADVDKRDADRKARESAGRKPAATDTTAAKGDEHLPDQRQENATGAEAGGAAAITKDPPTHYFRMMKELALLGYFTSEIGMTQAQRYMESPGRYDPCIDYKPGETSFASHA